MLESITIDHVRQVFDGFEKSCKRPKTYLLIWQR